MGWVKTVPKPHDCDRPRDVVSSAWENSEWQCDECNVIWQVDYIEYFDWNPHYVWERAN